LRDFDLAQSSRIAPAADKTLSLNVKGGKIAHSIPVQLFHGSARGQDHYSMWYIRLADGVATNCPDVGKAPTDANSKM
jgi:hypothetical protein